jgi:hypothetical protein
MDIDMNMGAEETPGRFGASPGRVLAHGRVAGGLRLWEEREPTYGLWAQKRIRADAGTVQEKKRKHRD